MQFRKYLVRYDPIDSYDSSRRSHFKMLTLPPFKKGVLDESDLMVSIEAGAAEAVWKWNLGLEKDSEYGVRDFQQLKGTGRFPGIIIDSMPDLLTEINDLTTGVDTIYSTAPGGQTVISTVPFALSDSERADLRGSVSITLQRVWNSLEAEDRLDSALDVFGITDFSNLDPADLDFIRASTMNFGDSVSDTLQTLYAYNDSDWAHWMKFETVNGE